MSLVRINDRIQLRHDAIIIVTFTERGTGALIQRDEVAPELVGAHLTVTSIMFNAETMSGGTRWRHPRDGRPLQGIQYVLDVDEKYVLTDGQLCDCKEKCCPTAA